MQLHFLKLISTFTVYLKQKLHFRVFYHIIIAFERSETCKHMYKITRSCSPLTLAGVKGHALALGVKVIADDAGVIHG